MKKLFIIIGILFSTSANAATISLPSYISGNDVTIANLNTTNTTVSNWANGGVEGGINIKAGSIVTQDMSNAVSTQVRWAEAFNNFTYSGMLPVTSANLTSNVSNGVSYINGYRVQKDAESHTYTASKDTYVYIQKGGYYVYDINNNGSTSDSNPPTPTTDFLLLAKVVTNGTAITSVTDLRTTSLQLTVTNTAFPSNYRYEGFVRRDSTTAISASSGILGIGTTLYNNTASTSSKTLSTAGNWIEGSAPSTNNLPFYVYAYNNSGNNWDIKFSSADPVYSDTSSNTAGTLKYYTTGGVNYRAIGWASGDSAGQIQTTNFGNIPDGNILNEAYTTNTDDIVVNAAIPADDTAPQSSEGTRVIDLPFKPTSTTSKLKIEFYAQGNGTSNANVVVALFTNQGTSAIASTETLTSTTSGPFIQLVHEYVPGSTAMITFHIRMGISSGTWTINDYNFGTTSYCSLRITEIAA